MSDNIEAWFIILSIMVFVMMASIATLAVVYIVGATIKAIDYMANKEIWLRAPMSYRIWKLLYFGLLGYLCWGVARSEQLIQDLATIAVVVLFGFFVWPKFVKHVFKKD